MLTTLLRHIFQVNPHSWKMEYRVIQQIKSNIVKENVMTLAESLKKMGEKKGRKTERLELTTQLLEDAIGSLSGPLKMAVGKLSPQLLTTLARRAHLFKQMEDLELWLRDNNK